MHVVAIVAMDGVVPFDLSIPCEVFQRIRLPGGRAAPGRSTLSPAQSHSGPQNSVSPFTQMSYGPTPQVSVRISA